MKKNGFTLIELLAVIVILAIIALIATPIVLNIIKGSKESATIRGAEYYLNAVELAVARNRLDNIKVEDGTYDILDTGNICLEGEVSSCTEQLQVDVKGEIPDSGTIKIKQNKVVYLEVVYDGTTIILPKPVSFAKDSWEIIIANIKAGNLSKYNVGDTREIELYGYENGETDKNGNQIKTYTVRIANLPSEAEKTEGCGTEGFSETACGFVIEFVDIITTHNMNPAGEYNGTQYISGGNVDGWPASAMRKFVTPLYDDDENRIADSGIIYDALVKSNPALIEAIIDTRVVSGYEKNKTANYTSTDKLYLLSTKEIYGTASSYDKVSAETRQLDYYKDVAKVTSSSYSGAKKYLNGTAKAWWLRSANSGATYTFYSVQLSGSNYRHTTAYATCGVAAAFRLG